MRTKILCFIAGALAMLLIAATTMPILNLLLDGDANGNNHSFTNLANVAASQFGGGGAGLSNLTAAAVSGSITNPVPATNVYSGGQLPTATIPNLTLSKISDAGSIASSNAPLSNAALANSSVTVNGTSGHIKTTSSSISLGGSATLDLDTDAALLDGLQGFTSIQVRTNALTSATNSLSFANQDYSFVSLTAVSTTGFSGLTTTNPANIFVSLVNTAGSNWNYTFPTSVLTASGVRGTITVTNGQDRIVWFRYNPGTGHTNLVECPNF